MSSNDASIRVEGLGKRYEIYCAPRDRLKQFIVPRMRRFARLEPRNFFREFWALRNVSFAVKKGESVGIVGMNGSGKSTLLQLISGTVAPTEGSVETKGRIAALLELGSGFNPDYSGRENAYMNGALLGLSREEMNELMPEIARFAGIGDFFDQPVKQYSSGMVVRVAFAVQAQVNPDILIVDEALAVGDAVFQHKCARRIHELRERGTTLLFVSHDPGAVATFCDRGLLLHQGEPIALGSAKEIVELYLARIKQELYVNGASSTAAVQPAGTSFLDYVPGILGSGITDIDLSTIGARIGTGDGRITKISIVDGNGHAPLKNIQSGKKFRLRTRIKANMLIDHLALCYRIDTLRGVQITGSTSGHDKISFPQVIAGQCMDVDIEITLPLRPDTYSLSLYLNRIPPGLPPVVLDGLETAAHIIISAPDEVSPIYIFDTPRQWFAVPVEGDPAGRTVERIEEKEKISWHISVLNSEFIAPDHWFWPQYAEGWEIETFRIFQRYLGHNSKFVDIGAWVGPTVIYAAALGATTIHAIEANPATVALLRTLVDGSPELTNSVTIHNLCISNKEDLVSFGNLDGSQETSSASSVRGTGFSVQSIKLYDFLRRNTLLDADLIKIDIEGTEELIGPDLRLLSIAGVKAVYLSMHPPFWSTERWPKELFDAIALFSIYDSKLRPLSMAELDRRCRTVDTHPEWGTSFGNFFEVLLLPVISRSSEGNAQKQGVELSHTVVLDDEREWTLESLRDFWISDKRANIKPGNISEFPEGFDPRKVLTYIHQWTGGGQITELGCGYGRLCTAFSNNDYRGFDFNLIAISKAKELFPEYHFEIIDNAHSMPGGSLLLAYTVFLHMPDNVLMSWIEAAQQRYQYIAVCEILGRDRRKTAGTTPVFNRDYQDYVQLLSPFKLLTEIRLPCKHYVNSEFASHVKNTDISFLVFGRDEAYLSGFALTEG